MKKLLGGMIVLVLGVLGLDIGLHALISPAALQLRVARILQAQTGLQMKVEKSGFQFLPWPAFRFEGVTLARPGCSPLATAQRIQGDIAFMPLLKREISLHELKTHEVWINAAPQGQPDQAQCGWAAPMVASAAPVSAQAAAGQPVQAPGSGPVLSVLSSSAPQRLRAWWKFSLDSLRMNGTRVQWGAQPGNSPAPATMQDFGAAPATLLLDHVQVTSLQSASPWLEASGRHSGVPFSLKGHVGPWAAFLPGNASSAAPWAFSLDGQAGKSAGERATLEGHFADVAALAGLHMALQGQVQSGEELGHLLAAPALSRGQVGLQGLKGSLLLTEQEGAQGEGTGFLQRLRQLPSRMAPSKVKLSLARLVLQAPSGAGGFWPAHEVLTGNGLQLDAPAATAPLTLDGAVQFQPETAQQTGPDPWAFQMKFASLQQAAAAWRILTGQPDTVAQGTVGVSLNAHQGDKGRLQLTGNVGLPTDVRVALVAPQLGEIVHDFDGQGQVKLTRADAPGGLSVSVDGLTFRSREASGTGTGAVQHLLQPHPALNVALNFSTLDGTALWDGWRHFPDAPQPAPDKQADASVNSAASGPAGSESADSGKPWRRFLQDWTATGHLAAATLKLPEVTYQDVVADFRSGDGRLVIDPLSARLDGTPLSGSLALQLGPQGVHFDLKAAPLAVPAGLVLEGLGWGDLVQGTLRLAGQVSGQGHDVRQAVGSLNGTMGFGVVDGRLDGHLLAPLAGPAAELVKVKPTLGLRCLAARTSFHEGAGSLTGLVLQAGHFLVTGKGTFTPGGAVDFSLQPHIRVAGTQISAPVQLKGTWDRPEISLSGGSAAGAAGMNGGPSGGVHQLDIGGAPAETDHCHDGLQAALGMVPPLSPAHGGGHGGQEDLLRALGIGSGK
ncbi:AsmA family protein [Oecophyllibacter saccharovorans]|uniref:AsmA family protein n=1 Tax=Oecophyllibacter saccharovorans TaxID=2558360 RepID=UPI001144779B|nr:AsmA family protein [Oecophyllibacter saccharovorans]QDH15494.1 AsmA family protein [Oecophyllibacter saccharovorans]